MNPRQFHAALVVTVGAVSLAVQAQTISTYAGGVPFDAQALQVAVGYPEGSAVAVDGTIYYSGGNSVYHFDPSTGKVTTVAGNGISGYRGDGGPAVSAELNLPWGVALDSGGNLFIADLENQVIRRVDATTGFISTVAGSGSNGYSGDGGPATSGQFSDPTGIAIDSGGNLFIADLYNNAIRRVDAKTGFISTVAGNGSGGYSGDGGPATSAQLHWPEGVAVDAADNLFVADFDNHVIRRVDGTTSLISTVAGNGTAGYSGDGGAATSAQLNFPGGVTIDAGGNLIISDTDNCVVRRVAFSGNTSLIGTIAGNGSAGYSGDGSAATGAQLNYPSATAVDAAGNLFIADTYNNLIRRVDGKDGSIHVISTIAGNGTSGFSGDGGAATNAQLSSPYAVAIDAAGNLLIADTYNYVIRRVDAVSGLMSTLAGNATVYGFSGDGGPAASAELTDPHSLAIDGNAQLYIADTYNLRVRRVATVDVSPPVIAPSIRGKLGNSGWYTGNVTVTWTVSDPLLPVVSQTGCSTSVVSADTGGQVLTCSAVGVGGNASRSVTITRDATPPTVSVTAPTPAATYLVGSSVNAQYSCIDATSGIATCAGPVSSGAPLNTATPGKYSFVVNATDAAGNAASRTVNFSVVGGSYTLTPNAVAFGDQALHTVTSLPLTLINTGAGQLSIASIELLGRNVGQFSESNNCPSTLASQGSCGITVSFIPTAAGTRSTNVIVTAGGVERRVSASGAGVVATYTVTPLSLAFGNEPKGVPSAPATVTVTNTGSVGLPIGGISIGGTNANQFSQTNNCSAMLAAGAACSIQVTFKATIVGDESASLKVAGQGGAVTQSVPLSGTVVSP